MKILVYGFRPYGKYKENITEKVTDRLKPRKSLIKKIYPVEFNAEQFLKPISEINPDVILGLGQCSRGDRIRIEQKAINMKKEDGSTDIKQILPTKSQSLSSSLKLLPADSSQKVSYNAGIHVCNYSMYIILDALQDTNILYTFLHIPHSFDIDKAVKLIEIILDKVEKQN